ncbi:MAG: hypothetical protein H3C30_05335 [Candidatus Hydrogenedentes bacterium]|nr:hypothetical protein [Candidatus Hydrogenedentota bacterium]
MESMPHSPGGVKSNLLSLADVSRLLPPGPDGKKISTCSIWRWCVKGCDGVKLPALRLGHGWYVRPEALESFGEELARRSIEKLDRPPATASPPAPKGRTEAQKARAIGEAREVLVREGVL